MITFVWAEDEKKQIGLAGHLPWHLPADLKHFKEVTTGHPIVMGRKTFVSLPKLSPDRQHIVLSKNQDLARKFFKNKQVLVLNSIIKLNQWLDVYQDQKNCVIGGISVFRALEPRATYLEKTEIKAAFDGDTVMSPIDYSHFTLIKKVSHQPDYQNKFPYDFLTYRRKGS